MRRSREGAWIEIVSCSISSDCTRRVAPARERGLKWLRLLADQHNGGRSREGAWIEIAGSRSLRLALAVAPARERGLKSDWPARTL